MSASGPAAVPVLSRRVVLLGMMHVGKTALTRQFAEQTFEAEYTPTIENHFEHTLRVAGKDYDLQIVDTAGQSEYTPLASNMYCLTIDGYMLVYSINSRESFRLVQTLYHKLHECCGECDVPIVLVGNKCDLNSQRLVTEDEGRALASKWSASFLETSAKENVRVEETFTTLIRKIEKIPDVTKDSGCSVQ